jgi:hypothetical protein
MLGLKTRDLAAGGVLRSVSVGPLGGEARASVLAEAAFVRNGRTGTGLRRISRQR